MKRKTPREKMQSILISLLTDLGYEEIKLSFWSRSANSGVADKCVWLADFMALEKGSKVTVSVTAGYYTLKDCLSGRDFVLYEFDYNCFEFQFTEKQK